MLLGVILLDKTTEMSTLGLNHVPVKSIVRTRERPKIQKFKDFYYFFVVSVEIDPKIA